MYPKNILFLNIQDTTSLHLFLREGNLYINK